VLLAEVKGEGPEGGATADGICEPAAFGGRASTAGVNCFEAVAAIAGEAADEAVAVAGAGGGGVIGVNSDTPLHQPFTIFAKPSPAPVAVGQELGMQDSAADLIGAESAQ
jgi:hypothetical protein